MQSMNRLHSRAALLAVAVIGFALCGFSCRGSNSSSGDYFAQMSWSGTWSHGVSSDPAIAAANPLLVANQVPAQVGRQGDGDPHQQAALAVQDWVTATGGRVALQILPDGDTRAPDIILAQAMPMQSRDRAPYGWIQGGGIPGEDQPGVHGIHITHPVWCYVSSWDKPGQIRANLRHEIGHGIGISHSPTPGDVMHPTPYPSNISRRDLATLSKIYGVAIK